MAKEVVNDEMSVVVCNGSRAQPPFSGEREPRVIRVHDDANRLMRTECVDLCYEAAENFEFARMRLPYLWKTKGRGLLRKNDCIRFVRHQNVYWLDEEGQRD